jgi:hypothetical protein
MRHLIQPQNESVLTWLLARDAEPSVLPTFPTDSRKGLVVGQLLNGSCYAEVITTPEQLKAACGPGLPLGRLFFHVDKDELYAVCDSLDAAKFGGRL